MPVISTSVNGWRWPFRTRTFFFGLYRNATTFRPLPCLSTFPETAAPSMRAADLGTVEMSPDKQHLVKLHQRPRHARRSTRITSPSDTLCFPPDSPTAHMNTPLNILAGIKAGLGPLECPSRAVGKEREGSHSTHSASLSRSSLRCQEPAITQLKCYRRGSGSLM